MGHGDDLSFSIVVAHERVGSATTLYMALDLARQVARESPNEDVEVREGHRVVKTIKYRRRNSGR